MYFETLKQFKRTLGQFDRWFDLAEAFAQQKSFDAAVLVRARLAPDQFPLGRQVQIACDTARLGASRLTGKEVPAHPDTEQTFGELRARVHAAISTLDELTEADFLGTDNRFVTQPRWEGKVMSGKDYFFEHVIPNFYFHAAHAYAILRHNGVPLGKRDYLGALSLKSP